MQWGILQPQIFLVHFRNEKAKMLEEIVHSTGAWQGRQHAFNI